MKRAILFCLWLLLLGSACTDDYEFGDATRHLMGDYQRIVKLRNDYCAYMKGDSTRKVSRAIVLAAVRVYQPEFPPDGICNEKFKEFEDHIQDLIVDTDAE